ncbi:hypothetical protein ABH994_008158 [Bradyrhizobium yuanmingense]|uniref:hypothetical protein n=1 Tax=Bradyrhizobium yuanmingense TaxID=108015 RepID=UPI003518944C
MQRFSRHLESVSNWIVESNKGDRFIFLIGRLQVHARSLDEAVVAAPTTSMSHLTLPAHWPKPSRPNGCGFASCPVPVLTKAGVTVVRQPQRLDEEMLELASFATAEAATEYLRANFPEPSSSR